MEPLGAKLRKQRRRLGLTLDELAARTGISKPYLSLIETGRVPNPPSDEKIRRLEQTLGFPAGELISQAHLVRTPRDVRAMLGRLLEEGRQRENTCDTPQAVAPATSAAAETYLADALQQMSQRPQFAMESVAGNVVPVINRASAPYPMDFKDLSYPPRIAREFVGCPDVSDKDAFAARVHGDSMTPKYHEGDIVIFAPSSTPHSGDDCFVCFDDGRTTFKRIFFETDQDGATSVVRLQPRNESHRPQIVAAQRVSGLYKAVYKYQRVDED